MLRMNNFVFKRFWRLCLVFTENCVNFITSKFAKKLKNTTFKRLEHSSTYLNLILRFLWPVLDLRSYEPFALVSKKILSNLLLKKFRKRGFETLWTFIFGLKVTSSLCSELLFMITKMCKKAKVAVQTLITLVFDLKIDATLFPKTSPMTDFSWKNFWGFTSSSQKIDLASSLQITI